LRLGGDVATRIRKVVDALAAIAKDPADIE
jgi:hypothetical protein